MFKELEKFLEKPKPFSVYTTDQLWQDPYISKQMLNYHLSEDIDLASRNKKFIEDSVDFICDYFKLSKESSVCDFGCGPGLYSNRLAKRVDFVAGIDFSKTSIDYAKKIAEEQNLNTHYVQTDYLDFKSYEKPFDLAIMIFVDFCVLSPEKRKTLLKNIHNILKSGAFLFFDALTLNYYEQMQESYSLECSEKNGFWSDSKYYALNPTFKYEEQKLLLHKNVIVLKDEVKEFFNWLQCYHLDEIKALLEEAGFKLIDRFSDVCGKSWDNKSNEMALVAQKI